MKKKSKLLTAAVLSMALIVTTGSVFASETAFGSAGVAEGSDYTMNQMLEYAIEDEYMAQAEYAAIIKEFDVQRPFSNIIRAEGQHMSLLLPLFDKYDVEVPENDAASRVVLPATIEEIYQAGITAEEKNINMYQEFLKEELPEDVEVVFERLLAGSEKHQAAFERAEQRGVEGNANLGNGALNGRGNGEFGPRNGVCDGTGIGNGTGLGNGGAARGNGMMNSSGTGLGNGGVARGTGDCVLN